MVCVDRGPGNYVAAHFVAELFELFRRKEKIESQPAVLIDDDERFERKRVPGQFSIWAHFPAFGIDDLITESFKLNRAGKHFEIAFRSNLRALSG
jgi:hypothetical protein